MSLPLEQDTQTLYDVLEVSPDASPNEIRAAYLRAKSAFNKDSLALYSLMDDSDTEELIRQIEDAFSVLSSIEKRRDYDRCHGLLSMHAEPGSGFGGGRVTSIARDLGHSDKVISIDRVPPMEDTSGEPDLLVAPRTDFSSESGSSLESFQRRQAGTGLSSQINSPMFSNPTGPGPSSTSGYSNGPNKSLGQSAQGTFQGNSNQTQNRPSPPTSLLRSQIRPAMNVGLPTFDPLVDDTIRQLVEHEKDWKGGLIRQIRELRKVSIEELSEGTKISKSYLLAIEEENMGKLPAPVYLRGFLVQIARTLKIPHEPLVSEYITRYQTSRAGK